MIKAMKLILITLMAFLSVMTTNTFAQDAAGKWEGTLNYKQFNGAFDSVSYDWDFEKWNTVFTIYQIVLELKQVRGEKYTGTYYMNCKGCTAPSEFRFDAVFTAPDLKGATEGLPVKGGNNPAYMELQIREDAGKYYLEGMWRSSKTGAAWQGKIALRRTSGGNPVNPNNDKTDKPNKRDAPVAIEEDLPYTIERSDNDKNLRVSTDKSKILTDDSGSDEEKQWKFVKAAGKYSDYYRIIPISKDDHCLEVDPDDGKVYVKPIEDKDSGEQYWAIEKKGDFYFLRCIGTKGTQVLDNDNTVGDGHTIVRRKEDDDASQLWKIKKQ